jgi:hypothetical protein
MHGLNNTIIADINKQNIFKDRGQILLFLRGPRIVFSNFEKHIGARRMNKYESSVQPLNQYSKK